MSRSSDLSPGTFRMPFDLTCPHCAKPMRVPDEMMGRRVACPHCTGQMDLPPAVAPKATPLPPDTPPPSPPPPADPFGFVPKPGAPAEPLPTHDRRRPAELPELWRGVYRGFQLLQLAGLLIGGGLAGFGIAIVALLILRVPGTDTEFVLLPFVLLAGAGVVLALIGYLLAGRIPSLDIRRLVLDWVLFWIGLPVFIFVLSLLWWRYLADLSRLLQVPTLRTRAVQFWWAFALSCVLVLAAFVVLFALGSKAAREARLAREQVERAPLGNQDRRARDREAEEAARRASFAVKIVSHGIAGTLFVAAGTLVGLGYVAAHRAAARAVLTKAPEEPPDEPRPRRRRPDRDRHEDADDRPRRRRRDDD